MDPELGNANMALGCFGCIVGIVLCVYTYNRAETLGMNAFAWAALVFFFGLIGFLIFMLFASTRQRDLDRGGQRSYGNVYGGKQTPVHGSPAANQKLPDPDFRDFYLEGLIDDGELREARKYLSEMIQVARESNDITGLRNYAKYEPLINKAAMEASRKKTDDFNRY